MVQSLPVSECIEKYILVDRVDENVDSHEMILASCEPVREWQEIDILRVVGKEVVNEFVGQNINEPIGSVSTRDHERVAERVVSFPDDEHVDHAFGEAQAGRSAHSRQKAFFISFPRAPILANPGCNRPSRRIATSPVFRVGTAELAVHGIEESSVPDSNDREPHDRKCTPLAPYSCYRLSSRFCTSAIVSSGW